jgi:PAS domain S-box-containing protein
MPSNQESTDARSTTLTAQNASFSADQNVAGFIESAPIAIFELDYSGPRFKNVNDAMCQLTGFSREELLAINPDNILDAGSVERLKEMTRKESTGQKNGEPTDFKIKAKDGQWLWATLKVKPKFKDEILCGGLVFCHDVTDRKKAEIALGESEKKCKDMIEAVGDFIWEIDAQGRYTFCSPQIEKWGFKPCEMIGKTPFDYLPPYEKVKALELFKASHKGFRGLETTAYDSQGRLIYVESSGVPFFDEHGILIGFRGISKDVTEQRKSEEEMKIIFSFFDLAKDLIIVHDLEGRLIYFNEAAYTQRGFSKEEIQNMTIKALDTPEAGALFEEHLKELMEKGSAVFESVQRCKDGRIVPVEVHARLIDSQGRQLILSICRDITDRKKIEENLKEISNYLNNLLNYANSPIIVWDKEFNITLFNHAFEELTGLSAAYAIGKPLSLLFPENRKKEALNYINQALEGHYWEDVEIPILHRNNEISILLWNSANIFDDNGKVVATIAQGNDITERKKAEEALRESEARAINRAKELESLQSKLEDKALEVKEYASRMEHLANERLRQLQDSERLAAIGATAGMVGHDIRNPLQAIVSDIYLARLELLELSNDDHKENIRDALDEIEDNVEYINKIVLDLQDFARPLNPHLKQIEVKTIIEEMLAKNAVPKNIEVTVEIGRRARELVGDADYLRRIISNLTLNAVQAMPNGGKLTLKSVLDKETGDTVLTVKDTGVGIPKDVKDKLFTPMFTTKSKGQGFGLAVVKRLTEALGGNITFESEEGEGTTFTMRFPPQEINGNCFYRKRTN